MKSESEKYQEDLEAELKQFMVDAVAFVLSLVALAIIVAAIAVIRT